MLFALRPLCLPLQPLWPWVAWIYSSDAGGNQYTDSKPDTSANWWYVQWMYCQCLLANCSNRFSGILSVLVFVGSNSVYVYGPSSARFCIFKYIYCSRLIPLRLVNHGQRTDAVFIWQIPFTKTKVMFGFERQNSTNTADYVWQVNQSSLQTLSFKSTIICNRYTKFCPLKCFVNCFSQH